MSYFSFNDVYSEVVVALNSGEEDDFEGCCEEDQPADDHKTADNESVS